jgi:hypothetical protein
MVYDSRAVFSLIAQHRITATEYQGYANEATRFGIFLIEVIVSVHAFHDPKFLIGPRTGKKISSITMLGYHSSYCLAATASLIFIP